MSLSNTILVAITEIKNKIDHTQPLKEKMLDAMKLALDHWLIVQDEEQFKAAVGAVLSKATQEEQAKINNQLKMLQTLSTILSGISVDVEETMKDIPKDEKEEDKLILNDLWRKAKDEKKK